MPGFLTVKPEGGLGNRCFEYACIKSLSLQTGQTLIWTDPYLSRIFPQIKHQALPGPIEETIKEESHPFDPDLIKKVNPEKNTLIGGFRQSLKYFADCQEEIKRDFEFPKEVTEWARGFLAPHRSKPLVAIQIRRGDYFFWPDTISPNKEQITFGMKYMLEKYPGAAFVFVSDGIDWCQANFGDDSRCLFSINHNESQDLCLISQCDHALISPSTFGWWGAYLIENKDKKICLLTPTWFNSSRVPPEVTKDIVPPEWTYLSS